MLKIKFYLEFLPICYSEIPIEYLATGHGFFEQKKNKKKNKKKKPHHCWSTLKIFKCMQKELHRHSKQLHKVAQVTVLFILA